VDGCRDATGRPQRRAVVGAWQAGLAAGVGCCAHILLICYLDLSSCILIKYCANNMLIYYLQILYLDIIRNIMLAK
jgi:hypothetical protein